MSLNIGKRRKKKKFFHLSNFQSPFFFFLVEEDIRISLGREKKETNSPRKWTMQWKQKKIDKSGPPNPKYYFIEIRVSLEIPIALERRQQIPLRTVFSDMPQLNSDKSFLSLSIVWFLILLLQIVSTVVQ